VESLKIAVEDAQADYGPLVTRAHLDKVRHYVDTGVKEGAKLVVDGRGFKLQGYENGNFIGGCLFDEVTPGMRIYKEEIFGPVLGVRARITRRRCGCRPSTTTATASPSSPATATPRAISPSGSCRHGRRNRHSGAAVLLHLRRLEAPGFGDPNQHGPDLIRFYTKTKTVTRAPYRRAPAEARAPSFPRDAVARVRSGICVTCRPYERSDMRV
jgi:malonate-semialdehyde dehydrogenase (acetylating)/methylmalonate-semialdehyde dehydrogenase